MFKIRVREYTPQGVKGKILDATNITVTDILNGSATLEFTVSQEIAGRLDAPIVVGVEYSVHGEPFVEVPYNNLFVMDQDESDDKDLAGMVTMRGQTYFSWMLAHTYLHWSSTAKDGERVWQTVPGGGPVSAGYLMHGMMTESKNRGWGSQLNWSFTGNTDSAGATWAANEKIKAPWRLLTPLTEILDTLTSDGLCDWRTKGLTLQLYRPGTMSVNRTDRVIGGTGYERIPVRSDASGIFTNLTVVPEKARHWLYLTNTGAVSKFGRLEATMTQSGIESHAEATKLAQPHLAEGKQPIREESFEWTPTESQLMPWYSFNVGDVLRTRARGAEQTRRIVGIIVSQGEDGVATVVAKAGEIMKGTRSKIIQRLGQVTVGDIVGGTGTGFPSAVGPVNAEPNKPLGVFIKSNTAQWLDGLTPQSTVEVEWSPVTMNVDETEAEIVQYEVWSRLPSELLKRDTATTETSVITEHWTPGVARYVAVRAQNDRGRWSEFSDEIMVTPMMPSSLVPKAPTGLAVTSNTGAFTTSGPQATIVVSWTPVTQTIEDTPVSIKHYNVWVDGALFDRVTNTSVTFTIPSSTGADIRVTAVSEEGLEGDTSPTISVTGAIPETFTLVPKGLTLSTSHGNVRAHWDGTYTTTPPVGVSSVRVEARVGASGNFSTQGAPLTGAGEIPITIGDIGQNVQVRLVGFDQLGRTTGTSAVSSIVVAGVEFEDFDTASQNYILGIESKANEAVKSTVVQFAKNTSATTPPTSGWSGTRPSRSEGEHIWTRTLITYNNGTTSTTTPFSSTGDQGPQGVPGAPGESGAATYTWIRYADTAAGGGISNNPTGKKYIGFAYNKPTATESNTPGDYKWSLIQGEQGVPGAPGADGQPTYTWVRYSANSNGSPIQTTPQSTTKYVGIAVNKSTPTPSSTPGDYTWSLFKGADGADGDDGISVTSVVRYYRLGTSKPGQPSGASPSGWSTTEPGYEEGQNLYYADKVTYSNNTISWSAVQLSSAYTASAQANAKADALEAGQTVLTKTVNGKNSRFVSMNPPVRGVYRATGSGVEVFENLAPVVEGSGTWVEVRRNRARRPQPSESWAAQWGTGGDGNATLYPDGPQGQTLRYMTWTVAPTGGNRRMIIDGGAGIPVSPGESVPISVLATRSSASTVSLSIDYYGPSGWIIFHRGPDVPAFGAGPNAQRVYWEDPPPAPEGATTMRVYLQSHETVPVGMWFAAADVVVGDMGPYFDGSFTPDSAMRTRWLGTENDSQSVMEIERVAGFTAVNSIAGMSSREGKTAVRIIPNSTNTLSYAWAAIPVEARSVGTALGTIHLDEPLTGSLNTDALTIRVHTPTQRESAPNTAGEHQLRLEFSGITSGNTLRLYHGGAQGSGDVWWSDIGLYAGTLPDDIRHYAPGDEYQQLGYRPGENEGDPDRLVIEHIYVWNGDDWVSHDIWAENVFAANSITTRVLNFTEMHGNEAYMDSLVSGLIETDEITSLGNSLNITANDTITIMAGRQDATDVILNGDEEDETKPGLVKQVKDLDEAVTEQLAAFVVDSQGAKVVQKVGENELQLRPGFVALVQGGVEATRWERDRMIVDNIQADEGADVVNITFEAFGNGTVIRKRG